MPTQINIGRVRPYKRGAWNKSTKYDFFDMVTSGGVTYLCMSETGAPAGTALTNATYWLEIAPKTAFATKAELDAGTVTNKAIAPNVAKPAHDEIKNLITALTTRTTALETKTTSGTVNAAKTATSATSAAKATNADNATKLNNQAATYYRCASSCSWTCKAACTGGCHTTCTGGCISCTSGCSGQCSNTCTGSCIGSCGNNCTDGCHGACQSRD